MNDEKLPAENKIIVQELATEAVPASAMAVQNYAFPHYLLVLVSVVLFLLILVPGIISFMRSQHKSIEKILGVLVFAVIIAGLPVSVKLVLQSTSLGTQAEGDPTPTQVVIDEITESSFRVSWMTAKPTYGALRYGTKANSLDTTVMELGSVPVSRHHIRVNQLNPKTTYFIEILSDGTWYRHNNQVLQVTTQ